MANYLRKLARDRKGKDVSAGSTEAKVAAGCEGKFGFATYTEAERTLKRAKSDKNRTVQPYKCRYCNRYHVGRAFH